MNNDELKAHYDAAFADNNGELYEPLAGLNLAAHRRRMALLDSIPLEDIERATVVDFGVGAWGFGCIFPKLKQCRTAIGFDISEVALEHSRRISASDQEVKGDVRFLLSLGYEMGLPNNSVDIFFCGECIEHVEDTKAFLAEIHRVMKPGGTAIFTTPNGDPWIYRQLGMRWCVGVEHVALMSFGEFRDSLEGFFAPVRYMGFNQSVLPGVDDSMPPQLHTAWVGSCLNDPENATSLIAVVRKEEGAADCAPQTVEVFDWRDLPAEGEMTPMVLSGPITGGLLAPNGCCRIVVPLWADRCNLVFWGHDWSGVAEVIYAGCIERVNLYGYAGGCVRHTVTGLMGGNIVVRPTGESDARSHADQVILFRAVFGGDRPSVSQFGASI